MLVRLDDRDARAAAEHAKAMLNQRTAMLARLRAKYALQQSASQQAGADLDAKVARASFAKLDAERYRTLRFRIPAPGKTQKEHAPKIRQHGQPWHRRKPRSLPQVSN